MQPRSYTHHHDSFEKVCRMVKAGVSPLMVGPSACGKTVIAEQVAGELGLEFRSTGAVRSEYQLIGFVDAHGRPVMTSFLNSFRHGGVFLFDEIDASDAQAFISVHAALSNGFVETPWSECFEMHPDFHCIAAANTLGNGSDLLKYSARGTLDWATRDRYVPVEIDYDPAFEKNITLERYPRQGRWVAIVHAARAAARELSLTQDITTRSCLDGAKLCAAGFEAEEVFRGTVAKGMAWDDAVKLWNATGDKVSQGLQVLRKAEPKKFSDIASINHFAEVVGDAQLLVGELERIRKQMASMQRSMADAKKELCAAIDSVGDNASLRESCLKTLWTLKAAMKQDKNERG